MSLSVNCIKTVPNAITLEKDALIREIAFKVSFGLNQSGMMNTVRSGSDLEHYYLKSRFDIFNADQNDYNADVWEDCDVKEDGLFPKIVLFHNFDEIETCGNLLVETEKVMYDFLAYLYPEESVITGERHYLDEERTVKYIYDLDLLRLYEKLNLKGD